MIFNTVARRSITQAPAMLRAGGAVRMYSAGDTGSPRDSSRADSFTQRERANEDYYFRQHESEKLAALRAQLKQIEDEVKHHDIDAVQAEFKASHARLEEAKQQGSNAKDAEKKSN